MNITYKTNHAYTSKSLTEWYFGKKFVADTLKTLQATGKKEIKVFQQGTGFLIIQIN